MASVQLSPLKMTPSSIRTTGYEPADFHASLAAYNDADNSSSDSDVEEADTSPRVYSSIRGGGLATSNRRGSSKKQAKYALLEMLRLPLSVSVLVEKAKSHRTFVLAAFGAVFAIIVLSSAISASYNNSSQPPSSSDSSSPSKSSSAALQALRSQSYLGPSYLAVAAVATDHPLCSAAALSLLSSPISGSAADAAVAAALCLGVVNMASSGLGGGCFALAGAGAWPSSSSVPPATFIDGREEAPAGATWNMFEGKDPSASVDGGLAVAVPGELAALAELHARFGRASWSDVVRPARDLASSGFAVSAVFASVIKRQETKIRSNAALAATLASSLDPTKLLQEGEVLRQPALARTLEAIMAKGASALYTGPIAEALVADVRAAGGILTAEDLRAYEPVVRQPLFATTVGGRTVVGAPPPSSGGAAVIAITRFMKGFQDADDVEGGKRTANHRLSEAMKHAFAMRMNLADPDFDDESQSVKGVVDDMISGEYMDYLRTVLYAEDSVQPVESYGGKKWSMKDHPRLLKDRERELQGFQYLEDHGTSHLSVVDADGNAVSLTSTVNTEFGSGVMSPSTGILLNNQMDDFASPGRPNSFGLSPSPLNYPAPKKRPLSSMSPTLVYESSRLRLSVGASGGPKIITATVQTILNHLFDGLDLFDAVTSPRLHDQLLLSGLPKLAYSKEVLIGGESIVLDESEQQDLVDRGHGTTSSDYMGTCQAVSIDKDGVISAMSDVRKGGTPMGLKKGE